MVNNELLKEFEEKFNLLKNELKFKASLDDLDKIFFLRDLISKEGYVSDYLSRMICNRIADTFMSWNNYLHGLIMPNTGYMISMTESQMLDDKDREEVIQVMNAIMAFVSKNSLIGLTKDKAEESRFIDDDVKLWNKFNPKFLEIMKKINKSWNEKVNL